jgi:acyl-CoA synthetase (NDP forming)
LELRRLLAPRSVAVIGGRVAARVVAQCERLGFTGPIHAVHPTRQEIGGRPAMRSVRDLPEPPDAVFVAVNRHEAIRTVADLAAIGAGGAVVYASGFAEVGEEGRALQRALVEAAAGMPVLGPNCYGLLNYLDRVALWPDQHGGEPVARGVAFVLQSGNVALNVTMQRRGLPVAAVVSLGNQAALGPSATIRALARDPRITAIALYLESVDDAAAFAEAVGEARERKVPVVALLAGRSEGSRAVALGHTASLATEELLAKAWFARLGVPVVHDLPTLLETAKLLHARGPLGGRRVVSLSCSGGEAALVADAASGTRLDFRPFGAAERERVAATLNELVTVSNPLDYHTFIWGDGDRMRATFGAVLGCGFDFGFLVLDFPREDRCDAAEWEVAARAFADAARSTGCATGVVVTLPDCLPEERARELLALGLVPLAGIREALAAIEAAAEIGEAWRREPQPPAPPVPPARGRPVVLDEDRAKAELARSGLPVPEGGTAGSPAAALALAGRLGFPLAVKAVGGTLVHKTEAGAVRLDIADAAALEEAVRELLPLTGRVRIERMVGGAVAELLLGYRRDPVLGGFLVLGAGGVLAELLADRVALPLPVTEEEVRQALRRLGVGRLLEGFRGRPRGDIDAVVGAVLAFAAFLAADAERVVEAEINPLLVLPQGRGAVAVDAFLRVIADDGGERA